MSPDNIFDRSRGIPVAAHFKLAQIYARMGEAEKAAKAKQRYQQLRSEYSTHLRKVTFRIP